MDGIWYKLNEVVIENYHHAAHEGWKNDTNNSILLKFYGIDNSVWWELYPDMKKSNKHFIELNDDDLPPFGWADTILDMY